jgi:hypothetical protein
MFWRVKCGGCVGLTTLPPSVSRLSRQCRILIISQPYRPPRPVTGIAFIRTAALLSQYKVRQYSFPLKGIRSFSNVLVHASPWVWITNSPATWAYGVLAGIWSCPTAVPLLHCEWDGPCTSAHISTVRYCCYARNYGRNACFIVLGASNLCSCS